MFRIIDFNHREEWDDIVRGFPQYDVYYLSGYQQAFHLHGDGDPILVYYGSDELKGCCVFFLRDISKLEWTNGEIRPGEMYDVVTPYGYGGWIFEGNTEKEIISVFWKQYVDFMKQQHIVDAFTRWCPWLANQEVLRGFSGIVDLGMTIHINTESEDVIFQNIKSKDRATIRKDKKNGVEVIHSDNPDLFDDFIRIYNATMRKDNALEYYYFSSSFYKSIANDLKGNWQMFYAVWEGKIIAMSIMLMDNNRIHYHLSGSVLEYRNLNATNLILYETAKYGAAHGYQLFHLGGGVGSGEDPLYKFKKSFNKNGDRQFSISKDCFDSTAYNQLVQLRKNNDKGFNESSSFFPLYRSES